MTPISLLVVISFLVFIASSKLPTYNINSSQVTISGLGYMAVQMHFAFSSIFKSAAIFAGGPFYCAQSNLTIAIKSCMDMAIDISLPTLISKAQELSNTGRIDSLSNLKGQEVYLFSGTADTMIYQGVMQNLATMYQTFGVDVTQKFDMPAEHSFPTDSYGNQCDYLGTPFINNCYYNGSYEAFKTLYGSILNFPTPSQDSNIITFNQSDYSSSNSSFNDIGYLYVPKKCQEGNSCGLHVSLHDCLQTLADISDAFVRNVGINEIAESNDFIVLYPQISKTRSNPNGCWDWWGYTDELSSGNYVTKTGVQMSALMQMMQDLGIPKCISGTDANNSSWTNCTTINCINRTIGHTSWSNCTTINTDCFNGSYVNGTNVQQPYCQNTTIEVNTNNFGGKVVSGLVIFLALFMFVLPNCEVLL